MISPQTISPHNYVLILDEEYRWLPQSDLPLTVVRCPIYVASSPAQAIAQAQAVPPCLVILVGNDQNWVKTQVHTLRQATQATQATIVALTESAYPTWEPAEESPDVDGFLVKPLTDDVLTSLVQSALAQQSYRPCAFNPSSAFESAMESSLDWRKWEACEWEACPLG